jgi:hypothetical protein
MMLIDEKTERAGYVGIGAEFYTGQSSDGSWREGSKQASVVVSEVPNGTYLLQVKPDPGQATQSWKGQARPYKGRLTLKITRDPPLWRWPILSFLVILAIPVFVHVRHHAFETKRWSESDHAG